MNKLDEAIQNGTLPAFWATWANTNIKPGDEGQLADVLERAKIEAAARKFGLHIPPQDIKRGIDPDPAADAIEDAARRFGLRLPPRDQRGSIEPVKFGKIPGWN